MRKELLKKILKTTDEEKRILSGDELDKKFYTAENDFVINDKRITKGARNITMRTHPRYTAFPPHRHTFAEMMLVFSGKITHIIDEKEITLSKGDILLLNKHTTHEIDVTDTEDLGMNIIISDKFADLLSPRLDGTLFSDFFKENAKSDGQVNYMWFRTSDHYESENLVENLVSEFLKDAPDEFIIGETLSLLFYHLTKERGMLVAATPECTTKESARRLEISSYIKKNYRSATLTDLSEKLYVSPQYLSKLIQKYFGKNFKELLLEERIERAKELLINSNIPIGAIVRNIGYENESYFHREFKKRVGKTPLAVRKSAKNAFFVKN